MNSNPRFGSFGNTTARIVCAYCPKLSREATPIGKPFLEPGTYLARKTGDNDLLKPPPHLLVREAVFAPPHHWGCRCAVAVDI